MSKSLECPVPHGQGKDSLARFRFETTQDLISNPRNTIQTLNTARQVVERHYSVITDYNPLMGKQKVDRALRAIALSAGAFIGATTYMNRVGPVLAELSPLTDTSDLSKITTWTDPIPLSEKLHIRTDPPRRFVSEVGGLICEWMRLGLLEPDSKTQLLADAAQALHAEFVESEMRHHPASEVKDDFEQFCILGSEENALGHLRVVLGFAASKQLITSEPIDPIKLAAEIAAEGQSITNLASVYRGYSKSTTSPMDPKTSKSFMTEAYDTALETGGSIPSSATAPLFELHEGRLRPAYPVLRTGPWREPGMCGGFPAFEARTEEETKGNQQFFRAMERLFGNQERASAERRRRSMVEAGVVLGAYVALNTVLPNFPSVDSTRKHV